MISLTTNGDISWPVSTLFPCGVVFVYLVVHSHLNYIGNKRGVRYRNSLDKVKHEEYPESLIKQQIPWVSQ